MCPCCLQVDRNHNQADLTLRGLHSSSKISSATAATAPTGTVLIGQVVTASAGLVRVHVGRRTYGKVALTDIHDGWVENPAEGITKGMYVKCCVVGKDPKPEEGDALQLSLKISKGASWAGQGRAVQSPGDTTSDAIVNVNQLKEGQQACDCSYCSAVTPLVYLTRPSHRPLPPLPTWPPSLSPAVVSTCSLPPTVEDMYATHLLPPGREFLHMCLCD